MKKILMVLRHTQEQLEKDTKYIGIINALEKMGMEVWVSYFEKDRIIIRNKEKKKIILQTKIKNKKLFKISRNSLLFFAIKQLYKSGFQTNYVYIRQMPCVPSYKKMLQEINKEGAKVIVEIPTYSSVSELKSDKRASVRLLQPILLKLERKSAAWVNIYALIGEKSDKYLGRLAINIDNGIIADNVALRKSSKDLETIHILALAKMARWHGFDRLIKGLFEYYEAGSTKNIYIHMVGPEGDGSLKEWEDLTRELGLEQYIIFEGTKYGKELDEIVNKCDVGCDSLGVFRKNLNVSSSLKVREYTARGIPFIFTISDNAIDENLPYWLKLENNNNPIDIRRIIQFVNDTRKIDNLPQKMNDYAKKNMSWELEVEKIFKSLEDK